MKVRFHLSLDLESKWWYLEAHDIAARRWFMSAAALWAVQMDKLRQLGLPDEELERLTNLAANGKVCAWLQPVELDAVALVEAGFVLQPTMAAVPRQFFA
jgi:hypothetical protein